MYSSALSTQGNSSLRELDTEEGGDSRGAATVIHTF